MLLLNVYEKKKQDKYNFISLVNKHTALSNIRIALRSRDQVKGPSGAVNARCASYAPISV